MLLSHATKHAAAALLSSSSSRLLLPASHGAVRGVVGGVDHDKSEPAASPWIKVLERPGDEHGNRSEDVTGLVENPYKNPDSTDVSADVPEKNPDTQPQAPIDPEVLAAAENNKHSDSVRIMAGKLNQAVGGDADFPETGGASIRDMATEIGHNIGDKLGVHLNSDTSINSKADQAVDRAADSASAVVDKARRAVTGDSSSSKDRSA